MSPRFIDLQPNDSLLDCDDVSRYCSKTRFNHDKNEPAASAFVRRPSERHPKLRDPSFNRLQFYKTSNVSRAIERIRQEYEDIGFGLSRCGRFVILNVGKAKTAVTRAAGVQLSFCYDPKPKQDSHALIQGLPQDMHEEYRVATILKQMVSKSEIYEGKPRSAK